MKIDLIDIIELRNDAIEFKNLAIYLRDNDLMDMYVIKYGKLVKHMITYVDDMTILLDYIENTSFMDLEKLDKNERALTVSYKHVSKFLSDIGYYDVQNLEFDVFLDSLYKGDLDDFN